MKSLDWVIEHWLVARWVVFAIVVGSVWGTLNTVLANDPPTSSGIVDSDGWMSFCCGLAVGLLIVPLWGIHLSEGYLSRNLSVFIVLILMTVSLTLGIETTEGALEDAGFWIAMFVVCIFAFSLLASPVNYLGALAQRLSSADDEQ